MNKSHYSVYDLPQKGGLVLYMKREEEENTFHWRWRRWMHQEFCGKLWLPFMGTYTCSEFCRHRLFRE